MKRFLVTMALLFSCLTSLSALTPVQKEEQHKATLEILMINKALHAGAGCSATAIAPHVLLTAQHCDVENGLLYLNQNSKPYTNGQTVTEKYYDNNDHMSMVVPSVEFKHFITYDASKVRKITQGEHLYFWGNPALVLNQYREVYATGTFPSTNQDAVNASGPFEMVSGPVVGGDSGSAIFSAEDGQLVGITTWGLNYGMFLGSYPLMFTQEQIDQATGHGMFVYIPDTRPQVMVNVEIQKSKDKPVDLSIIEDALTGIFMLLAAAALVVVLKHVGPSLLKVLKYFGRLIKVVLQRLVSEAKEATDVLKRV